MPPRTLFLNLCAYAKRIFEIRLPVDKISRQGVLFLGSSAAQAYAPSVPRKKFLLEDYVRGSGNAYESGKTNRAEACVQGKECHPPSWSSRFWRSVPGSSP